MIFFGDILRTLGEATAKAKFQIFSVGSGTLKVHRFSRIAITCNCISNDCTRHEQRFERKVHRQRQINEFFENAYRPVVWLLKNLKKILVGENSFLCSEKLTQNRNIHVDVIFLDLTVLFLQRRWQFSIIFAEKLLTLKLEI